MHHHHEIQILAGAWPFLLFGLATSLHCIGMCGPLSCIFCQSKNQKYFPLFLYHLGRLIVYSGLGFVAARLNLIQYPLMHYSAAVLGVILLLAVLGAYLPLPVNAFMARVTPISRQYPNRAALFLGLLTPMLPCGMLYAAVGAAAMAVSPLQGLYWMSLFALGTMPLMIMGQLGYRWIGKALSPQIMKVIQWVLMAISLSLFLWMRH